MNAYSRENDTCSPEINAYSSEIDNYIDSFQTSLLPALILTQPKSLSGGTRRASYDEPLLKVIRTGIAVELGGDSSEKKYNLK